MITGNVGTVPSTDNVTYRDMVGMDGRKVSLRITMDDTGHTVTEVMPPTFDDMEQYLGLRY